MLTYNPKGNLEMFRKLILASILLLAGASSALGEYTFANGFYWSGGAAYTRAWTRLYDASRGCYYYGYQYARAPYADSAKNLSAKTPGWRTAMIELLKQRDAYVLAAKTSSQEQAEFERSYEMLGLGSFAVEGYGRFAEPSTLYGKAGGGYDNSYYQQAGEGATLYGVASATATINAPNAFDVNEAFNHAARLRANSAKYESDADGKFVDALNAATAATLGERAVAAEIQAKGEVYDRFFERLIKAVESSPRTVHLEYANGSATSSTSGGSAPAGDYAALKSACASCHTGAEAKKGLILDGTSPITEGMFITAFKRVINGEMPPPDSPTKLDESGVGDVLVDLFNLSQAKSE